MFGGVGKLFVSVDLFNFVVVTKDVREGVSSSYSLFRKIGATVDKNFVIKQMHLQRTN